MAKPVTLPWHKLSIWVGDGASPEDFTSKRCGLTSNTFRIAGAVTEQDVPDCDSPDLPAWIERVIRSLSSSVAGSGLMDETTDTFWRTWALAGTAKNVRIVVDKSTPGYFAGRYVLPTYELVGSLENGKIETSIELQSDGAVTWNAGAP